MRDEIVPKIFKEGEFSKRFLEKLEKENSKLEILDHYLLQIEELRETFYPNKQEKEDSKSSFDTKYLGTDKFSKGTWVFYPWFQKLVHTLNSDDYYSLRTNRNQNLVTNSEQKTLEQIRVGIAGLSIGSNIALTLSHLGVTKFKLTDFDNLATSNLNRVPADLPEFGENKATLTAQKIFQIDPFSEIQVFEEGVNKNNLLEFLEGKLNFVVDAIDDFEMKVLIRIEAKKLGIPVLMFTNLGDSCLVDIERYDEDKSLEIFNGLLGEVPENILSSKMTEEDKKKFAAQLVGIANVPTKALGSLLEMGRTLVGRPQLASTVNISSGVAAFIIKKIALGEKVSSGRYLLHFDSAIFGNSISDPYKTEPGRKEILERLIKK